MAKITDKEKQDFDKLYQYVKKILGYGEDMALSKFMVMRLRGMSTGKFYANNKTKSTAAYDYNTIYLTFVYCKDKIAQALNTKKFETEQNKFNYIMAIVDNNINDVAIRLKNAKKNEEKIQKIEVVDYEVKAKKNSQSKTETNNTFTSLTDGLW